MVEYVLLNRYRRKTGFYPLKVFKVPWIPVIVLKETKKNMIPRTFWIVPVSDKSSLSVVFI